MYFLEALGHELCSHTFSRPFSVKYQFRRPCLDLNKLGQKIVITIKFHYFNIKRTFKGHLYSPTIDVILNKIEEKEREYIKERNQSFIQQVIDLRFLPSYKCQEVVDCLNSFTQELRDALRHERMRERVKSFERNARERSKKFLQGCEYAINRHSKILSIRLDTTSHKKNHDDEDRNQYTNEKFLEDCKTIEHHRNLFIKHIQHTFRHHLAFYAWKLEYGVTRGLHIHWFIILNGNKFQDRINIALNLGEHWVENITGGAGTYFNVNSISNKYPNVLRVVHHSELDTREHFERIAKYLTKTDFLIKIALPGNMRSFGCSKSVKTLSAKRGPKRQSKLHKDHMTN